MEPLGDDRHPIGVFPRTRATLKHDIGEGEVGEAVFHPAYAGYVEGYLGIVNGGPPR
jgi:hypothetical protein